MGYRGYGLPIAEVISEGNVGLMQAVKRFEPDKGFRLATYAMWWIKASIQEYILRSWSLVKMGTTANQKKLFFNLRKAKSKISALEEGDLRPDQVKLIAKRLGVTEQDVIDMNRRLGGDASLNAPIRDDGESGEWQDWLVDDAPSQERMLAESEESDNRHKALIGRSGRAQRARAAHLRGAAAGGRSDHARGTRRRVRRLARARAADRGARFREGAEGGEEPHGRDGTASGSAGNHGALSAPQCSNNRPGPARPSFAATLTRPIAPTHGRLPRRRACPARPFPLRGSRACRLCRRRDVEPLPLLQQLYVALHVDIDRRETDQEISVGDFDRETGERNATRLFVLFHQDARHVADPALGKIRRQCEHISIV